MARVTISDCVDKVENRFELVVLAGIRAKSINSGSMPSIDAGRDKPTVVSLREIAAETVDVEKLRQNAVIAHQRSQFVIPVDVTGAEEVEELADELISTDISEVSEDNGYSFSEDNLDDIED